MVLQNYICDDKSPDTYILYYVSRILEATVPLMKHPSEHLVTRLEEDMVKLILSRGKMIVESCMSCLGAIINKVSKNYTLAQDCFNNFFNVLQRFRNEYADDPARKITPATRPTVLRALFSVGLLCKHFNAEALHPNKNVSRLLYNTIYALTHSLSMSVQMLSTLRELEGDK